MATLSVADRTTVWGKYMREPAIGESLGLTKSELQSAINAADTWVSTNAVSFNTALPLAAQTNLTAAQKARLLSYVVAQRYLSGV